jgi:hypothetical protein
MCDKAWGDNPQAHVITVRRIQSAAATTAPRPSFNVPERVPGVAGDGDEDEFWEGETGKKERLARMETQAKSRKRRARTRKL